MVLLKKLEPCPPEVAQYRSFSAHNHEAPGPRIWSARLGRFRVPRYHEAPAKPLPLDGRRAAASAAARRAALRGRPRRRAPLPPRSRVLPTRRCRRSAAAPFRAPPHHRAPPKQAPPPGNRRGGQWGPPGGQTVEEGKAAAGARRQPRGGVLSCRRRRAEASHAPLVYEKVLHGKAVGIHLARRRSGEVRGFLSLLQLPTKSEKKAVFLRCFLVSKLAVVPPMQAKKPFFLQPCCTTKEYPF